MFQYNPDTNNPHQYSIPFRFDLIELLLPDGAKSVAVSSTPLEFTNVKFAIPPGEPYSELERMFMMFDEETWLAITATLLIALLSIQIINRATQSVKDLVFGSNVSTPTLNLVSTFLTGGQKDTPRSSFARTLLMIFVIFSLIIRTCHQSLLFKYLQADQRKPKVSSFEELVEKNFTYHGLEPLQNTNEFEDQGLK